MRLVLVFLISLAAPVFIFGQISMISWNICDFGQSRNDDEIRQIARLLKDVDLVAIQEVVAKHPGGALAVSRLADELNRQGSKWDYRISDPTQSSSGNKSERYAYLWKTSKLKITGGAPYLIKELATAVEREPFLITFKIKNQDLTILNYHACTHKKDFPERAEISNIRKWLLKSKFENVIFAGDMNLEISDDVFSDFFTYGYKSVFNGQKTSLKMECRQGNYLSRSEDNILYYLKHFNLTSKKIIDFIPKENCDLVSTYRVSFSDHLPLNIIIN